MNRFFGLAYQSILPSVAVALLSRVIGPFSFGSWNFVAKKLTSVGIDAVRVVLLGLREELLVEGREVEQLVLLDGAADGAAELLLRETAQARAVGEARGQAGPFLILVQRAVDSCWCPIWSPR